MQPIFIFLAALALGATVYTFSLGWRFHYGTADIERREARGEVVSEDERSGVPMIGTHFVWGMGTGIFVCFVHSLVLVYFLGTGKAIKEQTELQNWNSAMYDESKKNMSRALIPTTIGILLIVGAAISGGPVLIQAMPPAAHLAIAAIGVGAQVPVFVVQYIVIRENGLLMDRVVDRLDGDDVSIAL